MVHQIKEGDQFGKLIVYECYPTTGGRCRVKLVCACGNTVDQQPSRILTGRIKSCGCHRRNRMVDMWRVYKDHLG